jgi:tetratricopeptide (TPR) repeat protein
MNESFTFTSTINHESSLILLCLDYLKELRRTHHHCQQEQSKEEKDAKDKHERDIHDNNYVINYDYITLAIWALTRCFKEPKDLQWNMDHHYHTNYNDDDAHMSSSIFQDRCYKMGNDPFYSFAQVQSRLKMLHTQHPQSIGKLTSQIVIPTLDRMEAEMLHMTNHSNMTQSQKNHPSSSLSTYKYDDYHYSNSHRYYKNNGLDSSPLTLPTIVQEGLASLQAKTRMEAEMDLQKDPMYMDFYQAVKNKGYFQILTTDIMIRKRNVACKQFTLDQVKQDILRDRLKKVMTKFRLKVAAGIVAASGGGGGDGGSNAATDHKADVMTSSTTTITTTLSKTDNNHKSKHWSKDTMSLPSVPTASTDCEEEEDDDENEEEEYNVNTNVDKAEQISHGTALMPSSSSSSSSNRLISMNTQDCPTTAVTRESRKIVPLKKAIVSSVPLTKSSSHKSSLSGDHDSVNNIHFNEDDLCSRVSQKSGRSRVSSIGSSVMDDPEKIQEAETYKVKGNECMKQKKYEKAKHFYTLAIELLPFGKTSHVYYCNRAAALLSMRYFSEAAFDAEQSIELKPRYSKAYCRLGLANFFLGNYQQAIDAYTIALKYDPENETSKMYLERSEKKLQVKPEEFPSFKDEETRSTYVFKEHECASKEERPTLQEERLGLIQKQAQWVKERRLQNEETRHIQKKNDSKQKEDEDEAANQLKSQGNKAMARKLYDEAINFYSQALRLSPAGPSSHIYYTNRSAAFCHLGRYEDSESDAERALTLEPESSKAHSRLGLSRYFLRDYEGAVEAYESAVHYDPTNSVNLAYLEKAKRKLAAIQK